MPVVRPALVLLLAALLAGCDILGSDSGEPEPKTITLSAETRTAVRQSNAFGVSLYARVAADEPGNLMLSPLSASIALTMLLNGSDGNTYTQIRDMLGYAPGQDLAAINAGYQSLRTQLLAADPEVRFSLANAVFHSERFVFKAPFLTTLETAFDARVQGLNFADPASAGIVNQWASDNTNGRIPRVVEDEIPANTVMFLMNALYFKGDWSEPFDVAVTAPRAFRLAGGETVQVPTMTGSVPARTVRGDGYTALELPYGRRNFSMVVLMPDSLPRPGRSLAGFAAQLDAGLWTDATTRLDANVWTSAPAGAQGEWPLTTVSLPRFSFSYQKELSDQLQALGMVDAFGAANLSRMSDGGLSVTGVQQNTFVAVNEEGTEAAAVTNVTIGVSSLPGFSADRPFVFAIRERTTNTLVFIGQVANPAL